MKRARIGSLDCVLAGGTDGDGGDLVLLQAWAQELQRAAQAGAAAAELRQLGMDEARAAVASRHPDQRHARTFHPALLLTVERERAHFSSWYEFFPRSASPELSRHGTFANCEAWLPYVAGMGFDVLYFPPIHPIGRINRKGRNNTLQPEPQDLGSPWAIGADEGGHLDILPALGTLDDFRRLVQRAADQGLEVAMDIAFQCAPDHP